MATYRAPKDNNHSVKNTNGARYKSTETPEQRAEKRKEYYKKKKQAKKRIRNRMIIIVTAILLIGAIILAIMFIGKSCSATNKKEVSSSTSPTSTTQKETVKPTEPAFSATASNMPAIADDGSEGYLDNSIYIWQKKGFELFYGANEAAKSYAKAISGYKEALGKDIKVYNIVVPNHTEFGLPARLIKDMSTSQRENITTVYSSYTTDVKPIDIYNALGTNRDKYIYFNTDHHWTGLGAYYAYTAFAQAVGFEPMTISDKTKHTVKGFEGSLYRATNGNADLASNLDNVEYYDIPGDFDVAITDEAGKTTSGSIYYDGAEAGENTYGVFLWGDNPLTKIINKDAKDSRKLCIVKESYGNAFVPYVCANYKEVYVVDFRYYTGNLKTLCQENGINEVLYINGVMSANSAFQIEKMDALLG